MKVLKKSNLVVVLREYESNGEKKKVWGKLGEITTFQADDNSTFSKVELFHMPGASISVFPQEEKKQEAPAPAPIAPPVVDINPEDIPF